MPKHNGQSILSLPPLDVASPVTAVTVVGDMVWAGGVGGVARMDRRADPAAWQPCIAGLAVSQVAALASDGRWLFAGGLGGIARSADGGESWELTEIEGERTLVLSIALAPDFAQSGVALAVAQAGVLRTEDGGKTWRLSDFGIQDDQVTSLLWMDENTVYAGAMSGLYRSKNAGKAWREIESLEGEGVLALCLDGNKGLLAGTESGRLLRSQDGGKTWSAILEIGDEDDADWEDDELGLADDGENPEVGIELSLAAVHPLSEVMDEFFDMSSITSLAANSAIILAGTTDGLYGSVDDGQTWDAITGDEPLCLYSADGLVYAGLPDGLSIGNATNETWVAHRPPLHDVRWLHVWKGTPLLMGWSAGIFRLIENEEVWELVTDLRPPLFAVVPQGDEFLYASNMEGLFRSSTGGRNWKVMRSHPLDPGQLGEPPPMIAPIAFDERGFGLAISQTDHRLMQTWDGGETWSDSPSPFGVLLVLGLAITPAGSLAVTFDTRLRTVQFWRSADEGATWERGAEAQTQWPLVALHPHPTLIGLGNTVFVLQTDGTSASVKLPDDVLIHRFSGDAQRMMAHTTVGLFMSLDGGHTWQPFAADGLNLDPNHVLDVVLEAETLWVLYTAGRVVRYTF